MIDLTLGDPAFTFTELMEYAFERSRKNMHQYIINEPLYPAAEIACKDILDVMRAIAPSLINYGFWSEEDKERIVHHVVITSGGTSEAFGYFAQLLANEIKKQRKEGKAFKPVVVMTVPTYGFFATVLKKLEIPVFRILRNMDNGGTITPQEIGSAFEKINAQGFRIVAYYDCNPHNPTGLIRNEEDTKELADIIAKTNKFYESQPLGDFLSTIKIVDDFVGFGGEYGDAIESAYSFMQIPSCREDTFMMMGLSKVGVPGLRSGLMLASESSMKEIRKLQQYFTYFPARPAMYGLEGYYNLDESFQKRRVEHLTKLNAAHEKGGHLFKALLNGMDSMDELTDSHKESLISSVSKGLSISGEDAIKYLNNPIEGVTIVTTPKSGLCHIIDMNSLKGKTYKIEENEYYMLNSIFDFKTAILKHHNTVLVPSDWMVCKEDNIIFRITFACSFEEIIESVNRLRDFRNKIT